MGRKITFNLLNGQGTPVDIAHGWLSIRPTQEYTNGSYLVLATSTERRVTNGTVVFPDVQPSPGVDANTGKYPWCYMFTYRDSNGYKTSWYAAVPEGTGDLVGSDLLILVPDDVHYTIMRGPKGDDGDGLRVLGAFPTFEALQAAVPNPLKGDSYIVGTKVYVWDGAAWGASGDLTGAKGEKGDKGDTGARGATGQTGQTGATGATPVISAVANTGEPGSTVSVVKTGTDAAPVLTFTIPRGDKGEQGLQGAKGDKGDKGDPGTPGTGVPTDMATNGDLISYADGGTVWASPEDLFGLATPTTSGLMSPTDKQKLDVAPTSADLSTVASNAKDYTDSLVSNQVSVMATKDQFVLASVIPFAVDGDTPKLRFTYAQNYTPFVAPIPMRIVSVTLMQEKENIVQNASNYTTVGLRRLRAGSFANIASKNTTQEAWNSRIPWTFDSVSWTLANADLNVGDGINFAFSYTGTGYGVFPVRISIRWRPL